MASPPKSYIAPDFRKLAATTIAEGVMPLDLVLLPSDLRAEVGQQGDNNLRKLFRPG